MSRAPSREPGEGSGEGSGDRLREGPGDMIAADVTDPATPGRAVDLVLDRYGRLDGLVNGVGGLQSTAGFLEISDKQWESTFDLNLHAAIRMSRAALPALLSSGGSIVHVASEAARLSGFLDS